MTVTESWRLRCPQGHTSWERRDAHYRCKQCQTNYNHLVDVKTGGRHDHRGGNV